MKAAERSARRRLAYHLRKAMRTAQGVPARAFDGCITFQADVHRAALGIDPMAPWRGRYTTERGMWRVAGKGGLVACMAKTARRLKWKRIKPRDARIGDVGIIVGPRSLITVRMLHRGEWIARNETAWSMVRSKDVKMAWSVV